MRFSDIIGSLNISTYPQVALLIFISVFIAVSVRLLRPGARDMYKNGGTMPLDEAPRRDQTSTHLPTRLQETLP